MLKISEFSKLSHLTIKALRFYEKEGLLRPVSVDEWNNYITHHIHLTPQLFKYEFVNQVYTLHSEHIPYLRRYPYIVFCQKQYRYVQGKYP